MQPYFLPYIGYWQLMNAVDRFVVYDNIQYTKRGWINRNRILVNGQPQYFTLPLKHDSDFKNVDQRRLVDDWETYKWKLMRKITAVYKQAPFFKDTDEVLLDCFECANYNLFRFILNSLYMVKGYLDIHTPLIRSSTINIDHSLRGKDKVLAICKALGADRYINPCGGVELYDKQEFFNQDIELVFLKAEEHVYDQYAEWVPWLSILDIMMFNQVETIQQMLSQFIFV